MRTCKNLARTPLPGLLSWLRQRVQVAPGCSINGTTLGVAKDQNQTAAELFGAELQTANHGSLCMRAGVLRRSAARKCHLEKWGEGIGDKMKLRQLRTHGANKTRLSLQNFFSILSICSMSSSGHFPPGIASKMASIGARESAQPMIAV